MTYLFKILLIYLFFSFLFPINEVDVNNLIQFGEKYFKKMNQHPLLEMFLKFLEKLEKKSFNMEW